MAHNEKINISKEKPLVLFSPLDWGLGHTTRSIPLIRELIVQGCSVIVACNSVQKSVLIHEFPQIAFVPLEGYRLKYGRSRLFTYLALIAQLPKILIKVKREQAWLKRFLQQKRVDALVSDNRYGFFSKEIPSVFITHQLKIRTGSGSLADRIIQARIYKMIEKFSECWIPDFKGERNAAGKLSHPSRLPEIPTKYLGCVSRFTRSPSTLLYERLIILSGPEPQRTILEKLLLEQIRNMPGRTAIVRGLPGAADSPPPSGDALVVNHVPSHQLNEMVLASRFVISRSGYTTIMDLLGLNKKMILIPTPGQPEQEYLANYLASKDLAVTMTQSKFCLRAAEETAAKLRFQFMDEHMNEYKTVVRQFVELLKRRKAAATPPTGGH